MNRAERKRSKRDQPSGVRLTPSRSVPVRYRHVDRERLAHDVLLLLNRIDDAPNSESRGGKESRSLPDSIPTESGPTAMRLQPLRLLVVEDSPRDAEILIRELRRGGFDVVSRRVETSADMKAALCGELWDAVISDYRMPHFDGLEALRILRAEEKDIPFIIVSGTIGEATAVAAMKAGAQDYLMKGDLARLAPALARELGEAAGRHARRQAEVAVAALAARQEAILAAVPEIIMEVDANKVYTWANAAGLEFFGNDVVGKEAAFYFVGEQSTYTQVQPVFDGCDTVVYLESWQRRKDGEKRLLGWWCRVLKDGNGRVTGALSSSRDITEDRRVAAELWKSKEKYRVLVENINDIIYAADNQGILTYVNPLVKRVLGYQPEEMVGQPFIRFIYPDDLPMLVERFRALLSDRAVRQEEYRLVAKTGDLLWVQSSSLPMIENGRTVGIQGRITDITERKKAEEALRTSKELLSQTERIGKVGGWSFNIDTMMQEWTDEVYRIHEVEISPNPSVEKGINYYTKASRPIIAKAVQSAIEHGEGFDLELEIITAKGNTRAVHTVGKADLKNRRIYGFFQDITERKRAEQELQESRRSYRSLVENTLDIIYSIDTNGRFTYISPNVSHYGYAPEDLIGHPMQEFIHPDDMEEVLASFNRSLETEVKAALVFRFTGKSGDVIWFEERGVQRREHGELIGFSGVIRDITERRRAEEMLRESEAKYRNLIETTSTGYLILDSRGLVVDANQEYVRLSGHKELGEIAGRSVVEWTAGHEKERNAAALAKCIQDGSIRNLVIDYVDSRGCVIPVEINATVERVDNDVRIIAICRDITERRKAESAIQQHAEILRVRNEELERFNRASVGREMRMIELKNEINELCTKAGMQPRYAVSPPPDRAPDAGRTPAGTGGGDA